MSVASANYQDGLTVDACRWRGRSLSSRDVCSMNLASTEDVSGAAGVFGGEEALEILEAGSYLSVNF